MQLIKVVAISQEGKDIPETILSVMTLEDLKTIHEMNSADIEVFKSIGARIDGLEKYISILEKKVKLLEVMLRLK